MSSKINLEYYLHREYSWNTQTPVGEFLSKQAKNRLDLA